MNRSVIYILVIMIFIFIIGKYKLLPYLAAKKILKDAKNGRQDNGTPTAAPVPPAHMPLASDILLDAILRSRPFDSNTQPEKPDRRDMYFDYRFIQHRQSLDDLSSALDSSTEEMLTALRNRGICPDSFNIVPIGDGLLLAYVTYIL